MGSIGKHDVRNRLGYHPATHITEKKHDQLTEALIMLGDFLDDLMPHGRSKSSAFTKLEEASYWAHRALAEVDEVVDPASIPQSQHETLPTL